jgi:hypothetical protein
MGLFFTVPRKYMRLTINPASMSGHAESARLGWQRFSKGKEILASKVCRE